MKRHPSLEAFSRDHNVGLVLGRRLGLAAALDEESRKEVAQAILRYWNDEMADHFADEEKLLMPLIPTPEIGRQLLADHRELTGLIERLGRGEIEAGLIERTGKRLSEHIRWEERSVFPAIEASATAAELKELGDQTDHLEARRAESVWSPRRGELMMRRAKEAITQDRSHRLAILRWETDGGQPAAVREGL